MRGSITENKRLMRNEEGDEAVLHWEIRRSGGNGTQEQIHKVAAKFRVVPDSIYALVPVAKLWLRDPILNSISGWPITVWKNLQGERHHKGAAKQFACGNRFQQTELRVFASFQVSDERTGERMYLSGHRDVMFDVTSLAADRYGYFILYLFYLISSYLSVVS
ncbi:unnamed protein product [Nippostrongylus brasiliensis]|uniref:TMEM132 domain-containing protein n=1 Tax=Nippostrongylus brasiliensis TaxID=27835 RepID=A0A0N4YYJ8_NIPBR|nr:unnamed protein product [Nippostrongylus brasiliensis]